MKQLSTKLRLFFGYFNIKDMIKYDCLTQLPNKNRQYQLVTIILYPLYAYLQKWLTALSKKIIRSGSSVAGKYVGLVLAFLICIAVLLCFYAQMWYHINVFHLLTSGKIGMYF